MSVILIVRPSFRLAASVSHGEYADGQTDDATHKQCTHMQCLCISHDTLVLHIMAKTAIKQSTLNHAKGLYYGFSYTEQCEHGIDMLGDPLITGH